jgi:hypothetical protein
LSGFNKWLISAAMALCAVLMASSNQQQLITYEMFHEVLEKMESQFRIIPGEHSSKYETN